MRFQIVSIIVLMIVMFSTSAQAGKVEVNWHEPDEYTDIRSTNGGSKAFRKNVFKQLEKHWQKMAEEKLPTDMTLKVKVTNLNLAGDVRYSFSMGHQIRLVKSLYWPSIEFEYTLMQGDKVITTDKAKLKDMSFMDRANALKRSSSYYYDKRIITDWFVDDVQVMLAQWKKHQSAVMS